MRALKRYGVAAIGLLISALAIGSIFSLIPVEELINALRRARYEYVGLSLALILIGLWLRGVRWRVLLNHPFSTERAFNIMNIGYMVNGFVPLRLGEVVRAYLAWRAAPAEVPVVRALSTILIERALDLFSVMIILGVAVASAPVDESIRRAALAFTPTLFVGFILFILMSVYREKVLRILAAIEARNHLLRRIRVFKVVEHFLDGFAPLTRRNGNLMGKVLFWTAAAWFFSVISGYALMPAFFDAPDWTGVFLFTAAASLANALPAAPGSLGMYELSILLAFESLGYTDRPAIIGFAVMVHALNLGANALLGIYGMIREGLTLRGLSEGVRQMEQPAS